MFRGSRWLVSASTVALAAVLAACSSTSSSPAASASLEAVRNGSATAAQISEVMLASGEVPGAARVESEQWIELVGDTSSLPEEVLMLQEMRIAMEGVVAMDGSAGALKMDMGIPGVEPLEAQFLDGKAWMTDPSGEWQEAPELAAVVSRSTAAAAASYVPDESDSVSYEGTEEVNGVSAHKYVSTFAITEEFLSTSEELGLPVDEAASRALLGSEVKTTVWVTDDGIPVRFSAEIPMKAAFVELIPEGAEALGTLDELMFMYELNFSEVGKVTAPSTPPVQGA